MPSLINGTSIFSKYHHFDPTVSYNHLRNALVFYAYYIRVSLKAFTDRNSLLSIVLDPEKHQTFRTFTSAPVFSAADKMLSSRYKYLCQIENKGHDLYGTWALDY
jgi:hypothetical protein